MNKKSLKIVADYIRATQNEISIDESVYELAGVTPQSLGFVPRPAKVISRFVKQPVLFKTLMMVLRCVWCLGGAALFFFYEMLVFYKYSRRLSGLISERCQSGDYAVAFSSRASDVLTSQVLAFEPRCWITFPWVAIKSSMEKTKKIDVFSLVDGKDLLNAFVCAVTASRKIACRQDIRQWALQSYTAFRWFAVRIAFEKLDVNKIIIAEHYDRWAVLADSVISRRKKSLGPENALVPKLVLVQHGSLSGLSAVEQLSNFILPFELRYKLKSVTALFVYNEVSQKIFEREILSSSCVRQGVAFTHFSPAINLTTFPSTSAVQVLFVGHPICEGLHIQLLNSLVQTYDVAFYYKPHPTAGTADSVRRLAWRIIEGRETFPEVDFLIAYPSTLVIEYAASGISAILHPLDLSPAFSSGLLESIKSKLDALGCKK